MTLPLERARSRRPVTWLTLLGVLLLPAVIGGMLVAALQNPTERLDRMTAAIVNLDKPVTIDGQYTPLGRQLAAGLVDGSDEFDSNITWVMSNDKDAAEGLGDGTYQAVITIPKDFSESATSGGQAIAKGGGEAEQAKISVTTPPDARVADDLITQQIASVAASTMGTQISEATLGNVLVGFSTIGDKIGEAADGADKLASGAKDAAKGASAMPDGAQQLADGAGQLAGGAGQLAGGLDTIASKAREAGAGANRLGQGLTAGADKLAHDGLVPAQLRTAADGAAKATAGVGQAVGQAAPAAAAVQQGVGQLTQDLGALQATCDRTTPESQAFCAKLDKAVQAATALNQPAAISAGASDAAQKASSLAIQASAGTSAGLAQLNAKGTAELSGQLRTAGAAASQLGSGLAQLADGVGQSSTGARGLSSGATQLQTGAGTLAEGATTLSDGLGSLASGTGDLADGLHTAASSMPSFDEKQSKSLASVAASPVKADASAAGMFGPSAIPLLAAVVLWFGSLATFIAMRAIPGQVLTSRRSSLSLALRGLWPAAAIGAAQGVLVALIVQIVAKYDAGTWWSFAGIAVLAGIAFAAVNQALVTLFGGIGRWVAALIGVLAVATGLISTVPAWLATLGAAMPTAPALSGLIAGSGVAVTGLLVWAVLAFLATTLAVTLRRTTSARAVLATA